VFDSANRDFYLAHYDLVSFFFNSGSGT
jgi:hypothetical protein